ncbi:HPr family phosphocarrier protein [Myxococcota bacterium]|nr:HPr family phosphocarrier protein [Myxococcota bacterium]MBU1432959.1 HPr family phosphocarrier protein [Myxococcota bacterium]MBU1896313.1 HPr family phosphocarrier protein [Myxococcota bacterium]
MSPPVVKTFKISNILGLHARAAATLVRVTGRFSSDITISRVNGEPVNAKSILGLMTLAAGKGTEVIVRCSGVDQDAALEAIGACILDKFGEA